MKRPALLLLFAAPLLALAAPVPKDGVREKIEKAYGKIVDAKGDSTFGLDGDKLTVTLPADTKRDMTNESDNAPRMIQQVTGEFSLTVRIRLQLDGEARVAKGMETVKGAKPYLGAGVRIANSEEKWISYGFAQWKEDEKTAMGCPKQWLPGIKLGDFEIAGCEGVKEFEKAGTTTVTISLAKREDTVWAVCTMDGETKTQDGFYFFNKVPQDTLTVSLFAMHSSSKAHTVTFDQFKIESLKPLEKK